MNVVDVTYYDKPIPCFLIYGTERRRWVDADGEVSTVIRRWDKHDEIHYWWCLPCKSAGCECAMTARASYDLIREAEAE